MKKLLTIIFTFTFALSLCACNNNSNTGGIDSERQNQSDNGITSGDNQQSELFGSSQQLLTQTTPKLTADEALNIALEQAGVTKDSIRDLENELDTDNGILVYEISFEAGNTEYSYDINAETGAIVERDRDRND